ncbi:MAG: hypothetical protein ACXWDI_16290 [Nocardioides sp.]
MASHVADARAKRATVLLGGLARLDLGPAFYESTIIEGVTTLKSMVIMRRITR